MVLALFPVSQDLAFLSHLGPFYSCDGVGTQAMSENVTNMALPHTECTFSDRYSNGPWRSATTLANVRFLFPINRWYITPNCITCLTHVRKTAYFASNFLRSLKLSGNVGLYPCTRWIVHNTLCQIINHYTPTLINLDKSYLKWQEKKQSYFQITVTFTSCVVCICYHLIHWGR